MRNALPNAALHRLHRHAADRGRGGAHARGLRRLRQRLRLRPVDRRRRDGAALLREPQARAAARQRGAEGRAGAHCSKRPSSTRSRRRSWSASSAASTTSSPATTGWTRSPRTSCAHFTGRGYRGKAMIVVHRQGHRRAHVRQGAGALEGRDRAAEGAAGRRRQGDDARGADRRGIHLMETTDMAVVVSPGPERDRRPEGEGPRHRAAPRADAEGGPGEKFKDAERPAPAGVRLRDVDHRLRRADLLDDLPRQADAEPHADADHRAGQPRGAGQGERA